MKWLAIFFAAFVLLVVIVGLVDYRKEQARKADIELLKELTIRQREDFCSAHIGKLSGSKHEAALKWVHSFSLQGQEHRMTDEDLRTCLAF